jgi:hypothetical protein
MLDETLKAFLGHELAESVGAWSICFAEITGGEEVSATKTDDGRHQQPQTNETKDLADTSRCIAGFLERLACVDDTGVLQPSHWEELVEELEERFAIRVPVVEPRRKLLVRHQLPLANSIPGEALPLKESSGGIPVERSVCSGDVLGCRGIVVIDCEPLRQDVANIFGGVARTKKRVSFNRLSTILDVSGGSSRNLRGRWEIKEEVWRPLLDDFDVTTSGIELDVVTKRLRPEVDGPKHISRARNLAKTEDDEVIKTLASDLVGKLLVDAGARAEVAEEDGALGVLAEGLAASCHGDG